MPTRRPSSASSGKGAGQQRRQKHWPLGHQLQHGGQNIISNLATAGGGTVVPSTGLQLGLAKATPTACMCWAFWRALETSGDGNILSTPNLLTLDNEEAKIVIGQNVPFVTGQYTNNNSSSGSVNPFQTIERKDVGLTLRVKPQISENGTVKLQIFQEVSSVDGFVHRNSANGLITNKRSIESQVLVDDGSIVVLGGLLQDEYSGNKRRCRAWVTCPFGNLFKSESRSRKKTNLMVFLRPVVVRDAPAQRCLSMDRYDLMRGPATKRTARPAFDGAGQ
jgi:general secretion pathway protein D